jgi:hypothetical protein
MSVPFGAHLRTLFALPGQGRDLSVGSQVQTRSVFKFGNNPSHLWDDCPLRGKSDAGPTNHGTFCTRHQLLLAPMLMATRTGMPCRASSHTGPFHTPTRTSAGPNSRKQRKGSFFVGGFRPPLAAFSQEPRINREF